MEIHAHFMSRVSDDWNHWQRFQDEFDTSIHTNQSLSTIEKFSYLRSLLIENAVAEIEGLPLNVANYEAAMTILSDSFGRKQIIIEEHIKQLPNFPSVTNQWGLNRLCQLANQLEVHFHGLEGLQTPAEGQVAFLMLMVLPRMLRELTLEWKRGRIDEKKSMKELLFLKTEIRSGERYGSFDSSARVDSEIQMPLVEKKLHSGKKNTPRLHYMLQSNRHAYCAHGIIKFGSVPMMSAHENQVIARRRGLCFA
ncbi:hypothetical protein T07_1799 [Trichinella nelsoni]|uniref:Uncharacterized protein n=1 Tax=Trichinella nelsoni TaxID=6336 RepID=A0A0V0RFH1_9BILA|nr:hypothetical protein T07_1799 [Trichinella nelsoni]